MNVVFPFQLVLCVCWGVLGSLVCWGQQEDKPVVSVDGGIIYQSDVARELGRFIDRLQAFPPDQAQTMRLQAEKQVIEDLIGKLLLVNAARARGIEVTDAEIDQRLEMVVKSIASGGSSESFLQEAGISKAELAEDVRRNLLIQKLVEQLTKEVAPPSDEQLAGFFEENKARFYREETVECRHIFFDLEEIQDEAQIDAKRRQAEALRTMLQENPGLDFGRISKEKSDGPTAENGGYLGFMRERDFLPEFTKAAFAQKVGEIGQVVRTRMGFHIIKVESRTPARQPELLEIKDQVREGMLQMKRSEIMRRNIDEWRRVAKIELLMPLDVGEMPPSSQNGSAAN